MLSLILEASEVLHLPPKMGRVWFAVAAPRATHGAICFAVAVFIYANSLPGEFVFDDHEAIENNIDVRYRGEYSIMQQQPRPFPSEIPPQFFAFIGWQCVLQCVMH